MREYELVYIVQPDATSERETEIHDRADAIVLESGGQFLLRDDWGKRKLAFEIGNFQKGHYFQLNFLGQGPEVAELERSFRIDPDVLRFLTVQRTADVKDPEARAKEAAVQAAEQARRREERQRAEEEREQERARMEASGSRAAEDDDDGDDRDEHRSRRDDEDEE